MIYVVSATVRPEEYKKTEKIWRKLSYNSRDIKTKVIVDSYEQKRKLGFRSYDCEVYGLSAGGITKPLTTLTQKLKSEINDDDIIVVVSDDFYPPQNWDKYLRDFYKTNKGALSVKIDGPDDGGRSDIISIPILDGYTLKKLNGYVYHPAYNHLYSDNELLDNVKYLGLLHIEERVDAPKFKHNHWTSRDRKMDSVDRTVHSTSEKDKKVYQKRSKLTFEERIKHQPILSILICALEKRKKSLHKLIKILKPQLTGKNVELKICIDNGERSIPEKRNYLLNKSFGEYVCFIDDDDMVSEKYINLILDAITKRPDCVGIVGEYHEDGEYKKNFKHSIEYSKWGETDDIYERCPNHLNPIKREHIFKVGGFDETKLWGEDRDFSFRIYKYLKTEVIIDQPIYKYLFISKKS